MPRTEYSTPLFNCLIFAVAENKTFFFPAHGPADQLAHQARQTVSASGSRYTQTIINKSILIGVKIFSLSHTNRLSIPPEKCV